jgi:hypothetical protein
MAAISSQSAPSSPANRLWAEGQGGIFPAENSPEAGSLNMVFVIPGVSDDGQKSGPTRKVATSILCTNLAASNTTIEVRLYNTFGIMAGIGTANVGPNQSYTFSTQETSIYYDDIILGPGGGTDTINQGHGQVWADQATIICAAEVLDPFNPIPFYVGSLELFRR